MLAPQLPLNKELEKINKAIYVLTNAYEEGLASLKLEPTNYTKQVEWCCRPPSMDGYGPQLKQANDFNYYPVSLFGRYRWYDLYPAANDLNKRAVLKPTAPASYRALDRCQNPLVLLDLLTEEMEVSTLEKEMGSPLAALQLVVDVADQLLVRVCLLICAFFTKLDVPRRSATNFHQRGHIPPQLHCYLWRRPSWTYRGYTTRRWVCCCTTKENSEAFH